MCRGIIANAKIRRVVQLTETGTINEILVEKDWYKNILDNNKE